MLPGPGCRLLVERDRDVLHAAIITRRSCILGSVCNKSGPKRGGNPSTALTPPAKRLLTRWLTRCYQTEARLPDRNRPAELYHAADEHARHLRRAQGRLEDVLNLAGVLRGSIGDEGDSRAMQAETVLKIVERKLNKALNPLDRHDSRHRNLFFAYFDLMNTAEEGGEE